MTRPGGTILVVDQLAPVDPLAALELNRFERARDPSTTRVLADTDLRGLFDSNGLVLRRDEVVREPRDLDAYLDLAGCEGAERELRAGARPGRLRGRRRLVRALARPRPARPSPGASACAQARPGGTSAGRRSRGWSVLDGVEQPLDDERRVDDEPRARAAEAARAAGSPRVSTKPGLTVCTAMPRGASSTAIERENASCACFDAEYGPAGDACRRRRRR